MPVDRELASAPFTKKNVPKWMCPTCHAGVFRHVKDSLHFGWTATTTSISNEDFFGPENVELRFSALFRCSNDGCKEVAAVAGTGEVEEDPDLERHVMEYSELLYPTYFNPSPPLINIPFGCPADVTEQLKRAFIASWDEPGAAAGRVRIATELVLTHLKVPKTRAKPKGGRTRLNLHQRIEALPAKHAEISDALLAIKWLGNAGAHEAEMSRDTIYDALDILEFVLKRLYEADHRAVERLVKKVNQRKGPAVKRGKKTNW